MSERARPVSKILEAAERRAQDPHFYVPVKAAEAAGLRREQAIFAALAEYEKHNDTHS